MIDVKIIKKPKSGRAAIGGGIATAGNSYTNDSQQTLADVLNFNAAVSRLLQPYDANNQPLAWAQATDPDGAGGVKAKSLRASVTFASSGDVVAYQNGNLSGGTGGGGLDITALESYLTTNGYATQAWVSAHFNDYVLTKAAVEAVLTGNITTHTHNQYLTEHQSLANYYTKAEVNAKNYIKVIDCFKTTEWNEIRSRTDSMTMRAFDVYGTEAGGPYTFGNVLEIASRINHWQPQLWFDGAKDGEIRHRNKAYNDDTWGDWHILLDTHNYASILDTRYYTKTEINTKLTDGSVTKVGTATVGGSAHPIYLNAGTPTACGYSFGNATGNAPLNNGTLNVSLNADLLDGVHGSSYLYATCYCVGQKTGVLVKTDVPEQNSAMFTVHITGNTYTSYIIPIDTYIQFYSYNNSQILGWAAINNGANFGAINVFIYEGYVCLWLPQPWVFMTFNIFVNYTNSDALRYNRVISVTHTTMPTEGVTRLVTITPKQSALTTDNVASATKLQTARTIWGQSFNGTANVSGTLSGVEAIIFNANAKIVPDALHLDILTKSGLAHGLAVGGLLASNTYSDWSKVPANGIYSKGDISTGGVIKIGGGTISWDAGNNAFMFSHTVASQGDMVAFQNGNLSGGTGGGGLDITALEDYLTTNGYATQAWVSAHFNDYVLTKAAVEAVLTGNITSHTHSQYLTEHQSLANYYTKTEADGKYLISITKSMVEAVLTGNITTHTHNQYLTEHQSLANYYTKTEVNTELGKYLLSSAYTASDILTKIKTVDGAGSGLDADMLDGYQETSFFRTHRGIIPTAYIDLTTYTPGATDYANYKSGTYIIDRTTHSELFVNLAVNAGSISALQFKTSYNDNAALYFRKACNSTHITGPWRTILTELNVHAFALTPSNYAATLDGRYYTESEINAMLTNGSVTKVGTVTIGSAAHPIYLNAGTPTACGYSFGNATGNAALNNGTLNVSLNADMLDGVHLADILASNVASASKLQTARTINGTAFDGTAGITTAKWGTARNLTIGNTAKSVDGSGPVAWSLAEIGALAATANAVSASKLATPHTLWGQSFDGTDNVAGTLSGVEDILFNVNARLNATDNAFRFFTKGGGAQGIQAGNLLISYLFSDANKVPENGIYSKDGLVTDGSIKIGGGTITWDEATNSFIFSHTVASQGDVVAFKQ